jgi:chitodextrinase
VLVVHENGQYAANAFEASVRFDRETKGAQEVSSADGSRHLTYYDVPEFTRVEGLIHRGRLVIRVRCSGDVAKERLVSCTNAGLDAQLAKLETVFPSVVPPAEPSNVDAQVFRDRAIVSWSASRNDGGAAEVGYSVTSTPPGAGCQTTETACTIRGLVPGTSYTFTVAATNTAGPSGAVTSPRAKRASLPSGPVRNASAASRGSAVRVTWKAPAVLGGVPVLRYEVRSTPAGGTCETRSTSCDITGLTPGREYRFTVVARNAAGISRKVMTKAVRIPVPPPAPKPVPLPAPEPDKPTVTFS